MKSLQYCDTNETSPSAEDTIMGLCLMFYRVWLEQVDKLSFDQGCKFSGFSLYSFKKQIDFMGLFTL